MKLNKLMAGFAASVAGAVSLSAAASASIAVPENPAKGLDAGSGSWKILLRGDDVDQGVKVEDVARFAVQFTTDDPDFFEGNFGGSVFMTCGPASDTPADHNWVQQNWWGVVDEDLEINTQNPEEPVLATKVGDHTYEVSVNVDDSNCLYAESTYAGAGIQEWGSDMSQLVVLNATFYDAAGNVLIAYDANGNVTSGDTAAPEQTTAAPAETQAPAAGNVDAADSSSKGSPDTGIADAAAIAGLAIVAGGAVLVTKKRK